MSYEYMQGMGTAEEATRLVAEAQQANTRQEWLPAAALLEQAIAVDPSRAHEFRTRQVQMYAAGGDCARAAQIFDQLGVRSDDPRRVQYQEFIDRCRSASSAQTGKQTSWPGEVGETVSNFFSKTAGGTPGPTSISQIAPNVGSGPSVSVDDDSDTPWYVQFAPHLVIGGLGAGAVVVLVIAMKKRG